LRYIHRALKSEEDTVGAGNDWKIVSIMARGERKTWNSSCLKLAARSGGDNYSAFNVQLRPPT
jgi:hypothetical protein